MRKNVVALIMIIAFSLVFSSCSNYIDDSTPNIDITSSNSSDS